MLILILLSIIPDSSTLDLIAIWKVESNWRLHPPPGDRGRSIGPLQIQYRYWKDSRVPGAWESCNDIGYACTVVRAYWKRYHATGSLDRALLHNGGPRRLRNNEYIRRFRLARGL